MTNKHYSLIYIILSTALLAACQPVTSVSTDTGTNITAEEPCMGPAKKDTMCTMQYDPVCGCNGKTYSNACMAKAVGVLRMEKGDCEGEKATGSVMSSL